MPGVLKGRSGLLRGQRCVSFIPDLIQLALVQKLWDPDMRHGVEQRSKKPLDHPKGAPAYGSYKFT